MAERNKIFFLSDLHLGASYIADRHDHERRISSWLRSIASEAKAIYLLGDVLDYWYEYKEVVPRGYIRFFGTLAELTDKGVEIIWLKGNHDIWIFDYLPKELGVKVIDGLCTAVINEKKFVMEHGDGVGDLRPAFRFIRSLFRNRICQFLFSSIHPGLTVPLAHKWSAHSRLTGKEEQYSLLSEADNLVRFCNNYQKTHPDTPADYFIFGHRHILINQKLSDGATLIVLGDCFKKFSFGVFDGTDFLMSIIPESI